MTLTLDIPPDLEAKLRELASAAHKTAEDLVVEALKSHLADEHIEPNGLHLDIWLAEFRDFTARTPRGNTHADVTRDSIYEGRGE